MKSDEASAHRRRILLGLIVLIVGVMATNDLFHVRDDRLLRGMPVILLALGPALTLCGAVMTVMSWIGRTGPWFSRRMVLVTALLMLAIGAFPWLYTPLIIRDGGMEGSGMLGTILFILVGLPGLLLLLVAFLVPP